MNAPSEGEVHLWLLDLDHHDDPRDADLLSDIERARAGRLHAAVLGRRVVTHRAWLRRVLALYLDLPPAAVTFTTVANGKPALAAVHGAARPQFNLSHSGGWGLLAVTRAAPVGVDLEAPRALVRPLAVARRHFGPAEYAWVAAADDALAARFLTVWTRKEAFIKATGEGLARGLSSFDVRPDQPGPVAVWERQGDGAPWFVLDLALSAPVTAALCTRLSTPSLVWAAPPPGRDAALRPSG